jgi:septum formation protein
MRQIVLASTSPYRRQLLQQLQLPFVTASPLYVEQIDQGVAPELVVRHLSLQKAQSLTKHFPDALIIGSDQVFVDPRKRILGKPGSPEKAFDQLRAMAGRTHSFYTGIAIVDSASGETAFDHAVFAVTLRELDDEQIRAYLARERPYDCAGSFRIEGLGIALMEKMEGEDYTSLIGLPLIRLVRLLARFGIDPLAAPGKG